MVGPGNTRTEVAGAAEPQVHLSLDQPYAAGAASQGIGDRIRRVIGDDDHFVVQAATGLIDRLQTCNQRFQLLPRNRDDRRSRSIGPGELKHHMPLRQETVTIRDCLTKAEKLSASGPAYASRTSSRQACTVRMLRCARGSSGMLSPGFEDRSAGP